VKQILARHSVAAAAPARRVAQLPPYLLLALAVCGSAAAAPQLELRVDSGPHHAGEPIEFAVVARDFELAPAPELTQPAPEQGSLRVLDMTRKLSSRVAIVNGRIERTRRANFVFRLRYSSFHSGPVVLGPFSVAQGAFAARTAPLELDLRDVPATDDLKLRLEVPAGRVYLGQHVPIALEFWIARRLQESLQTYTLTVPFFDEPALRFLDDPSQQTDTGLRVDTAGGRLELRGIAREEQVDGRRFVVVRIERKFVADEIGTIEAEAPSVVLSRTTRWRRNLFGAREAVDVRKLLAVGEPVRFDITSVPSEGRPASFGGAVGSGFTLSVHANRSVVQVGEPIVLGFELRGDGNLAIAGLPPLDAEGLLDPQLFRTPGEPPAGVVEGDRKHFDAVVRVLHSSVDSIPPLDYAWFDPQTERFVTTRSQPIALAVGAAQVIGAAHVQHRASAAARAATGDATGSSASIPSRARRAVLTAADLAMEADSAVLLGDERGTPGHWGAPLGLHGLGIALVLTAWIDRRRRDFEPGVARQRAELEEARQAVEAALSRPDREAAAALASALRAMLALSPNAGGAELDALLGECDALSYAPESSTRRADLDETQRSRARRAADAIAEQALTR
jgi:hypothetical protein